MKRSGRADRGPRSRRNLPPRCCTSWSRRRTLGTTDETFLTVVRVLAAAISHAHAPCLRAARASSCFDSFICVTGTAADVTAEDRVATEKRRERASAQAVSSRSRQ